MVILSLIILNCYLLVLICWADTKSTKTGCFLMSFTCWIQVVNMLHLSLQMIRKLILETKFDIKCMMLAPGWKLEMFLLEKRGFLTTMLQLWWCMKNLIHSENTLMVLQSYSSTIIEIWTIEFCNGTIIENDYNNHLL